MTKRRLAGVLLLCGGLVSCGPSLAGKRIACEAKGPHWFMVDTTGVTTATPSEYACIHADTIAALPFAPYGKPIAERP